MAKLILNQLELQIIHRALVAYALEMQHINTIDFDICRSVLSQIDTEIIPLETITEDMKPNVTQ